MGTDLRDGLKLRLGYEVAREIERTPVIAPGVSDAAVNDKFGSLQEASRPNCG